MRPIARATIQAGLIDDDTLAQFKRWGVIDRGVEIERETDPEIAVEQIQVALESEEQVRLQSTDLDLLRFYLDPSNQRRGTLVVVNEALDTKSTKTITFALRRHGGSFSEPWDQFIIPWISDSIADILTNGKTCLRYENDAKKKMVVYFTNINEMYFGSMKTFMICEGLQEEYSGHN